MKRIHKGAHCQYNELYSRTRDQITTNVDMSRSPLADVDFRILRWARETAGLDVTDAATRVGTSAGRLEEWESGNSYPTVKRLRQLAKVYMRPMGLFFLPELPEDPERIRDFRRIAEVSEEEMSSALRFEIRLAWERHHQARELASDLGEQPQEIRYHVNLRDDPDRVAAQLRDRLGIPLAEQAGWSTRWEAFNSWRSEVERLGVLVFQTGVFRNLIVEPAEARGFSVSEQPFPVIIVNGKDHASAKCFTLIHELVHVLLREGGICDLHDPFPASAHIDRAEVFCNRVAGALLVPSEALLSDSVVGHHEDGPAWSDAELEQLSRKFWVSSEVILRRLLIAGQTTQPYYQQWRSQRNDRFPGRGDTSETPRIPTHTRVVIRNGKLFPRLVLRALRENVITTYEASAILHAGPERLVDVENVVH